jgi:protein TonB
MKVAPRAPRVWRRKPHQLPRTPAPIGERASQPRPTACQLMLETERVGQSSMRVSLLASLLIHILLITITLPSFSRAPDLDATPKKIVYVSRWVPPAPKPPPRRQVVKQETLNARRIPVPDPTPEEPEPVIEPEPEPEPLWIPPDVQIVIGAPVPPPLEAPPIRAGFGGVTYPILIESTQVMPDYPELARLAKVSGNVILEAIVRKTGSVTDLRVLRQPASGLGFGDAAIAAVTQWRYKPGVMDGRPVAVYFTIVVEFRLE